MHFLKMNEKRKAEFQRKYKAEDNEITRNLQVVCTPKTMALWKRTERKTDILG